MKPRLLLPTPACFAFTVILAISVHLPAIWSQETQPYGVCSESVQCGNIPVEYPFWGFDRSAYCGHPGFQLTCQSDVPVVRYQSLNYRVLDIDTSVQTITIARNDLWTTNCPQPLYNTTYNSTLFSDDNLGQRDVSLYYDCDTTIPRIPLANNYQFSCDVNGSQTDGYFFRTDMIVPNMANFLVQCENHIDVPVNQASAARLAAPAATTDDLRSALTAGFNLTWTANYNECSSCIQSNGQCGSNSTSPDLFVCYCANGNFSSTCNGSNGGGEYPFWGLDRPAYCGHPGFQLTCRSDVPVLSYQSLNYRVIDIDTSTQTITVVRNDLWTNFCPEFLYNASYNSMLFNGDNFGQQNVSLYYKCDTSMPRIPLSNTYQFSCNVNKSQDDGFFMRTDLIVTGVANFLAQCEDHIDVQVTQSSAARLGATGATTNDLRSALTAGFNLQWTANNDVFNQCIRSSGQCGSNSTSPDVFVCYCANGNFSLTCTDTNEGGGNEGSARKLIIGISCAIGGLLFIIIVILCRTKRLWVTLGALRAQGKANCLGTAKNHQIEIFIRNYGTMAPKRFTYSEIKKMTNSFVEILGQGGYGSVYKGQLPDDQLVAVKLLSKAVGDGKDFINEVASIGRTSHVNIVTLLGFCFDGKKRALLYEFMPNGSLDKFLRHDGSRLDWNTLFQIAKGIGRGLEYLHQDCNTRIVHFDIKPHNILLDEDFVPKISDFGLAKLCKRKESIVSVTGARGTAGYMAPEVFFKSFGGASHKSDVYSYGMMVLEMTGARRKNDVNITSMSEAYFPDWIYKKVEGGENLGVDGVTTEEEEEIAKKMVMVSLWCIQSDPSERPSISKVVEMLEGSIDSLPVPPGCFWSSPTRLAKGTSPLAMESSSRALTTEAGEEDQSS